MSTDSNSLEDRFTSIVRSLTDAPDNAAFGMNVTLKRHNLSISDLRVVVTKGDQSSFHALIEENRSLRGENARLRGSRGLTWNDFVEACSARLDTAGRKWRGIVEAHLKVPTGTLRDYEKLNRVPVAFLQGIETLPPDIESAKTTRRRTNFQEAAGEIVDRLKQTGLSPTRIAELLDGFHKNWDGDTLTLNHILGRRTVVEVDQILPADNSSPVTIKEMFAIANALWGRDGNIKPTEIFVRTHVQLDVRGFKTKPHLLAPLDDRKAQKLRDAVHKELELRGRNLNFKNFSMAFQLLPKRTKRISHTNSAFSHEEFHSRGVVWFGHVDAKAGLMQFFGLSLRHATRFIDGKHPVSEEIAAVIHQIDSLREGLAPDDPNFVDTIQTRVKDLRRKGLNEAADPTDMDGDDEA